MTQQNTLMTSDLGTSLSLSSSLRTNCDRLTVMATWGMMMDECYRETISFIAMRMDKDGEALRQSVTCPSLQDYLAFHIQWADETLHDFGARLTKILAICTKHGADAGRQPLH